MARGKGGGTKTTKTSTGGGGRKETKEERRARLKSQEEAREQCFKLLPYAGGVVVFLLLAFILWVRSVPPKAPKPVDMDRQAARLKEREAARQFHTAMQEGLLKAKLEQEATGVVSEEAAAPEEGAANTEGAAATETEGAAKADERVFMEETIEL